MNIKNLLNGNKTPCFVYDTTKIDKQLINLRNAFDGGGNLEIFYSYKTNTSVASYLCDKDLGLQVTSLGHLKEALKLVSGEKILFSSRELSRELLDILIKNKVKIIVNSESQLKLINSVDKDYSVGIRIDTKIKSRKTSFATSNLGLGIPYTKIEKIITPNIKGFHNHLASQITDLDTYKENAKLLISLANKFDVDFLDIGGGFPISYTEVHKVNINKLAKCYGNWKKKLYVEPGRFLVGPSGKLITKVIEDNGKVMVINASIFNSMRDRILSNYSIKLPIVEKGNSKRKIVGNSPSSSDFFGEYRVKSNTKTITFLQAGAYCISNDRFTGVERPREYLLIDNKLKEIK